jgi:hypothetical protein
LLAILDGGTLIPSLTIEDLACRVVELARRIHRLAEDFSVDLGDTKAVQKLPIENPIEAFTQAKGMGGVSYFKFDGRAFGLAFEIQAPTAFATLIREILDWRLAQYLSRGQFIGDLSPGQSVICRVSHNASGNPILFLPSGNSRSDGTLDILADGRPMKAVVAKYAVNVVHPPDNSTNELPRILRSWFGKEAGTRGRNERVRFRKDADTIVMERFDPSIKSGQ